jgi:Holliday junction resolvasome RuvABC endonuclease subunit
MQYLGVALLEGENLMWYAVKTFPEARTCHQMRTQVHEYLSGIIQRYQPTILAIEEPFYAQSLLSDNLRKLTEDLKTWGKWKGLRVHSYYPAVVKAYFCRDQKTKQSLAEAMIEHYPFLRRYLTSLPWRRRYWFHVFDAIGLGLMCQKKLARS